VQVPAFKATVKVYGSLLLVIALSNVTAYASGPIQWGVNIHDGGSAPQTLASKLAERNLKRVRMDLWGLDHNYLVRFKTAASVLTAQGIQIEAVVFTPFSNGQARCFDTSASLTEVEQTAYNATKPQIDSVKNLVHDFELQNEISLYPAIKKPSTTGQNATDYDVAEARLQAAVCKGMSRAIDDVRKESGLPLRIILGTTDRSFGFLTFMQQHGVLFDIVGYHIYPWKQHESLDKDPWYGVGGPLGQLAKFNLPIHINEFNAGEIYSGTDAYASLPVYENVPGQTVTEAGFSSFAKHLTEIATQTIADVRAVLFYEAWDEPKKVAPENHFGLYYDEGTLSQPKITLLLATCFAGGTLSQAEKDSLSKRNLGQCLTTAVAHDAAHPTAPAIAVKGVSITPLHSGRYILSYKEKAAGEYEIYNLTGTLIRKLPAPAGSVIWDGCSMGRTNVLPGVYLVRLKKTAGVIFATASLKP
jgi:hypothetical protein